MSYHYSDPSRETDPHALPDFEVFEHTAADGDGWVYPDCDSPAHPLTMGWYYAFGFPGCLWDSEPVGPFDTEDEAIDDARDY
jgi:hypothetical protein